MPALEDLLRYRDDLWAALGGGVRRVRDADGDGDGDEITYNSTSEIKEAIGMVEHQIRAITSGGARPGILYPVTSKGL